MREPVRGAMQSLFLSDEEMGKKDDDHARGGAHLRVPLWAPSRVQPRKFIKRACLFVLVTVLVILFVRNIPTDVGVRDHRRPVYGQHIPGDPAGRRVPAPPFAQRLGSSVPDEADVPPGAADGSVDDGSEQTYNGRLRFMNLRPSLRAISNMGGGFFNNKNVLFVGANLKTIATLLPMACEMGMERRSFVHFAVMSRSEIDLDELRQINGIGEECHINFHDARPDHPLISTFTRMENGVALSMAHIELFMHPQAIIMDNTDMEEKYLRDGMHAYAKSRDTTLIDLPKNAAKRLGWITKLDSASLNHWNKISIDILVHAYPGASGSLTRLLHSLSRADFGAGTVPHLTIELPNKIDKPTEAFLQLLRWPPGNVDNPSNVRQLSLRHRIPKHGISEDSSSVRFLESFWPINPAFSHVLVLSPQAELSPEFFNYVKYTLLEYRYSIAARVLHWDQRLFGISLELPPTGLDGVTKFSPPAISSPNVAPVVPPPKSESTEATAGTESTASKEGEVDKAVKIGEAGEKKLAARAPTAAGATSSKAKSDTDIPPSFLWQAPNSNAVLVLGESWVELHGFVSQSLEAEQAAIAAAGATTPPGQLPKLLTQKLVSKKYPAWLEHALRLCQARGFWTLYPNAATASSLVTVHNELYQPPEEYEKDPVAANAAGGNKAGDSDEVPLGSQSLVEVLPRGGGGGSALAPFSEMPLLGYDGQKVSVENLDANVLKYAAEFRTTVGGCTAEEIEDLTPDILFCSRDE